MAVPGAKFRVESNPDARGDMQALRQKDSIVGKAVAQTLSAIATRGMLKRVTAVAQGAVNNIIANWETLGKQDKYAQLERYFGTVAKRKKAFEQTTSMFEKCTGAMFTTPYSGSGLGTNDASNDTALNDRGEGHFKRSNADVYENTGVEVRRYCVYSTALLPGSIVLRMFHNVCTHPMREIVCNVYVLFFKISDAMFTHSRVSFCPPRLAPPPPPLPPASLPRWFTTNDTTKYREGSGTFSVPR
jgi:hypothetical protein